MEKVSRVMFQGRVLLLVGVVLWLAPLALAQQEGVRLETDPQYLGLAGLVQSGQWTGLLVTVENQSAQPRRVVCEWSMSDCDGDPVQFRRLVSLGPGPGARQRVWLYAQLPMDLPGRAVAEVRVLEADAQSTAQSVPGRVLARQMLPLAQRVSPQENPIGMLGSPPARLGLNAYESNITHQEACRVISGLGMDDLPDRWYGLAMLRTLVWTPDAGDPGTGTMGEGAQQALREWVRRGGHLVIVLPAQGQGWTASPLRDLLPVTVDQIRRQDDVGPLDLPTWLGQPLSDSTEHFTQLWFDLPADSPVTTVLRTRQNHPLVVARGYGLGRVTLIGLEISDRRLAGLGLPAAITGDHDPIGVRLWPTILGWRGPVYSDSYIQAVHLDRATGLRSAFNLAQFIPVVVNNPLQLTLGWALLAMVLAFGLYWVAAGPVEYALLRRRRRLQKAWVWFAATIGAFSVITWGSAWLLRPAHQPVGHFSIVDIDLAGGWVHAHSWMSLFVPTHARTQVQVGAPADEAQPTGSVPDVETVHDVLSAPGMPTASAAGSYLDPQRYPVDAGRPGHFPMPMRATSKTLTADVLLPPGSPRVPLGKGVGVDWSAISGHLRQTSKGLEGELQHDWPWDLTDVLLIYNPGDGSEPVVWRGPLPWSRGQPWKIAGVTGRSLAIAPLHPNDRDQEAARQWQGHLGDLLRSQPDRDLVLGDLGSLSHGRVVELTQLLSFYALLPPPDFWQQDYPGPRSYERTLARELDLSARVQLRGVVLLAHVETSAGGVVPLPVNLRVDGQSFPAAGWTMIRVMIPLEE